VFEKIQISLKYDNNDGTLHEDRYIFMIIHRLFLLRMREVSEKKIVAYGKSNHKAHILCPVTFFRKWCHLRHNMECGRARYVADDTLIWGRKDKICMLDN